MFINFIVRGRLGNAIFRYMAIAIICLNSKGVYTINNCQSKDLNETQFFQISQQLIDKKDVNINCGVNMNDFYQHDTIYRLNKNSIIEFIKNNPTHYVLTDGISAGDMNCVKFLMIDIINTPNSFNKCYKNVLHIRLEDFVQHNLYIRTERIINLLEKNIINDTICIVCKKPETEFETNYINIIVNYLLSKNITVSLEHNDTITDYYIMKEAETLICSKSTMSWCAALLSDKLQKCYVPHYEISIGSTFKYPIDNTELY